MDSLLVAALIVFALWVVILGIYLATSRRQLSMEDTIEGLERELETREEDVS